MTRQLPMQTSQASMEPINMHMTEPINRDPSRPMRMQIEAGEGGDWSDWSSTLKRGKKKSHVNMTGTITRGKKRGESVDIGLDLTDREILQIKQQTLRRKRTSQIAPDDNVDGERVSVDDRVSLLTNGVHIMFLGLLISPLILLASFFVSFYFCLLTWTNVFNHFYDERTACHKVTLCPLLMLFFPLILVVFPMIVAVYAAFIQISWNYDDWCEEVSTFEKGFFGYLCHLIKLDACSPYTVIELDCDVTESDDVMPRGNEVSLLEIVTEQPEVV